MTSPALHEIASAVAAVVSAVGGGFAAIAAFRSAASARDAARSVELAERRALLREVSSTASKVQLAVIATTSRGAELKAECQSAQAFSGSVEHSGLAELTRTTAALVEKASAVAPDAELFSGGARSLAAAPVFEIDRVLTRLAENLLMVQTIREELDRKYAAMSAQNLQSRQAVLQRSQTR